MAFRIKQNDTLPNLPFRIMQPDGVTPQDLTGATIDSVVRVKGSGPAGAVLFKKECTLLDQGVPANLGRGIYDWETGDTATAGAFEYELEITWPGGDIQTVPVETYLDLTIVDDIG